MLRLLEFLKTAFLVNFPDYQVSAEVFILVTMFCLSLSFFFFPRFAWYYRRVWCLDAISHIFFLVRFLTSIVGNG